jgi:hypothetical protein
LIKKLSVNSVACVWPQTAQKLVERGWGFIIQNGTSTENSIPKQTVVNKTKLAPFTSTNIHLAFLLNTRSPYYNDSLQLFAKNLHSGDYLFIIVHSKLSSANELVQQAKSMCSTGVNVNAVLLYSKLDKIKNEAVTLPKGIDWIIYDYENGSDFSPEFTVNETSSLVYFDEARDAVKKYNVEIGSATKFMVTPPYGELKEGNWDWGLAARHMDGIDVQTQRLVKDMPTFRDHILKIADQIQAKSPKTFFMIQFSLRPSVGTVEDTLNGINYVKDLRIDAFLIFYDQYSQNSQLEKFFSLIRR